MKLDVWTPAVVAVSPWVLAFEVLHLLALLYTSAVTPFELGFLWTDYEWGVQQPQGVGAPSRFLVVFVLNRLSDATFLGHLLVRCNTAFETTSRDGNRVLCTSRRDIVLHYLSTGGLPLDALSTFPLDLLQRSHLAVVALRACRLLRLRYLVSFQSDKSGLPRLKRALDDLHLKSGHIRLLSFLFVTAALSHLLACGLHLVAVFQVQSVEQGGRCNWVTAYFNTYRPDLFAGNLGDHCAPLVPPPTLSSVYLAALVWSVETMTTVGYGDVVAVTDGEHVFVVFAMLVGGAFFSFVVGSFMSVLQELSEREAYGRRTMDVLNDFLTKAAVEPPLAARVRHYTRSQLEADPSSNKARAHLHRVLDTLTPALRVEIAMSTHAMVYARLPLLGTAPLQLLIECSFGFQSMTFPPGEALCHAGSDARRGLVMTLVKGLVHVDDPLRDKEEYPHGTLLSASMHPGVASLLIGEEAIWAAVFPRQPGIELCSATIAAVTTASCMAMRASALLELLALFPGYVRELKRPVLARFTRSRIRLMVAGAHRVRALMKKSRNLHRVPGVSFADMLHAAQGTHPVGSFGSKRLRAPLAQGTTALLLHGDAQPANGGAGHGGEQRVLGANDLAIQRRSSGILLLTTMKPALVVYVVSCAAPDTFRAMSAAALTIQRIFRGGLARKRLRARLEHAHLSKLALQRLASKISGVEPAVAVLESLRRVHMQLRSAMEQQEQVVAENVERAAVARERLRMSAQGLPRASTAPGAAGM